MVLFYWIFDITEMTVVDHSDENGIHYWPNTEAWNAITISAITEHEDGTFIITTLIDIEISTTRKKIQSISYSRNSELWLEIDRLSLQLYSSYYI